VSRGLRRALIGLAAAALLAGIASLALQLGSDHNDQPAALAALRTAVGWAFAGVGLFAWWRRPDNRIGAIMTAAGFAWFLQGLADANSAGLFTAGLMLQDVAVPLAFGLVAFPTGRIPTRPERLVVGAAWIWATALTAALTLVTVPGSDEPQNLLLVGDGGGLEDAFTAVHQAIIIALALALIGALALRWRGSTAVQRREMAPVCGAGGIALLLLVVSRTAEAAGASAAAQHALDAVTFVAVIGLPFGFLAGLVRARVVSGRAVSALVQRLGSVPAPGGLRDALAEALGDPSLELAYWVPEAGEYVDARGGIVPLPGPGSGRAWTPVEREGAPVAAILHDPALGRDPESVRAAGAAAALALENERLDAELRRRVSDLRDSRARIIAAGDAERRSLERDLHDGAQQRLVGLALRLRLARRHVPEASEAAPLLDEAMTELTETLGELRELARGIHPALLADRGLDAALPALADRSAVPVDLVGTPGGRLPPPVETAAYFVVAEALTNVAKYAGASRAEVSVAREDGRAVIVVRDDGVGGADPAAGSGLRGLADRVGALDGRLEVQSPRGGGTLVRAEIPCGS
jgi:signal transduction histidine kinase